LLTERGCSKASVALRDVGSSKVTVSMNDVYPTAMHAIASNTRAAMGCGLWFIRTCTGKRIVCLVCSCAYK